MCYSVLQALCVIFTAVLVLQPSRVRALDWSVYVGTSQVSTLPLERPALCLQHTAAY